MAPNELEPALDVAIPSGASNDYDATPQRDRDEAVIACQQLRALSPAGC